MKITFAASLAALAALIPGTSMAASSLVAFESSASINTIVVRTSERKLYLILGEGKALRYSVGVGRVDRQWLGESVVSGKFVRPNWAPPPAVKHDHPSLPDVVLSGAAGNPLGAAALTLSGGDYAIHGTNMPKSIGGFVSYGCIRMSNNDVTDLFKRVIVGSRVLVTR